MLPNSLPLLDSEIRNPSDSTSPRERSTPSSSGNSPDLFSSGDPSAALRSPEDTMPDTAGQNFYDQDHALRSLLRDSLSPAELRQAEPHLSALGALVGGTLDQLSRTADTNTPVLHTYDQRGRVINRVDYHPSYEEMVRIGVHEYGLVAMSHRPVLGAEAPLRHTLKYAFWYLFVQAEFGLACPMNMTDSAVRVLRRYGSSALNARFAQAMLRTDAGYRSCAQFMTEKQGGSDVGANLLRAVSTAQQGEWRLFGDKWFCSNVSADLALVLARPEGAAAGTRGLAMFLMPRVLEDGSLNAFRVTRLKSKLGTRGMASGEVTFDGALAYQVGELATGFKQMMSMVNSSRLSNALRSAALMRRSLGEALTTARGRAAFGSPLVSKPLMQDTLLRMLLETEAAAAVVFHTARVYELADEAVAADEKATGVPSSASVPPDPMSRLLRLLTPIVKGVICKRARTVVAEGMEARGGNGYIDDWVDGKLLRDAHLGSIWEGTTSIVALDVQRALLRNDSGTPFSEELLSLLDEALQEGLSSQAAGPQPTGTKRAPLGRTPDPRIRALVDLLRRRAQRLTEECAELPSAPEDARQAGAITLMNRMYDLLASALLLRRAARQLRQEENHRGLAVLLSYLRQYVVQDPRPGTPHRGLLASGSVEALLLGEHLPEAALQPAWEDFLPLLAAEGLTVAAAPTFPAAHSAGASSGSVS